MLDLVENLTQQWKCSSADRILHCLFQTKKIYEDEHDHSQPIESFRLTQKSREEKIFSINWKSRKTFSFSRKSFSNSGIFHNVICRWLDVGFLCDEWEKWPITVDIEKQRSGENQGKWKKFSWMRKNNKTTNLYNIEYINKDKVLDETDSDVGWA